MTHAQTEFLLSLISSAIRLGWTFLAVWAASEVGWLILYAVRRWGVRR